MSEQSWFNAVAVVLVLVVLVGFLAGFGLSGTGSSSTSSSSSSSTPSTFNVSIQIGWNPNTGLDEMFPSNLTVPAGVPVKMTFYNYDQGVNTVVGMPANTSHTFSIKSLGINVPIPAALSNNTPTVTSFVYTFSPGQYMWNCVAPCDPVAMTTLGYMQGILTVT